MLCFRCRLGKMDRQEYLHIERDTQKDTKQSVVSAESSTPREKLTIRLESWWVQIATQKVTMTLIGFCPF